MRRSGPYFERLSAPQPIKLCGGLGMHPGGRLAAILRPRKVPCVDSGDLIHRRPLGVPDNAARGSGTSRGSLARSTLAPGQAGYPSRGRCLASGPDAPHRTTQAPSRLVAVNRSGALALPPRPCVQKSGQGNAAPAASTRGYPTAIPMQAGTERICETGNLTDDGIVIGLALGHRRRG